MIQDATRDAIPDVTLAAITARRSDEAAPEVDQGKERAILRLTPITN